MLPLDAVTERFAGICDRAAEHGVRIGIEFLPFSEIPDAATAWQIVRDADRPNGGLDVDSWHHFRGAADLGQLLAIPPGADRGRATSTTPVLPVRTRGPTPCNGACPEKGCSTSSGSSRRWTTTGWTRPVSVEVFSDELNALDPRVSAQRAHDTALRVLSRSRHLGPGRRASCASW